MRFQKMIRFLLLPAALCCWSVTAHAVEVTKKSWLESMETMVPTHFCQSQQYFRQCFDVSAEKCEEVAASATRVCLEKLESRIPTTLNQPQDGTRWGTQVGICAGQNYEGVLIESRISNAKCNNPNNWR